MGRGQQQGQAIEEAVGADGLRYRRGRRRLSSPLEMPKNLDPFQVRFVTTETAASLLYETLSGVYDKLNYVIRQVCDDETRSTYWRVDHPLLEGERYDRYDDGRHALQQLLVKTPFGGRFEAIEYFYGTTVASGVLAGQLAFSGRAPVLSEEGEHTLVSVAGVEIGTVSTFDLARAQQWERAGVAVSYRFLVAGREVVLDVSGRLS